MKCSKLLTLISFIAIPLLVACGGGGGGSSPAVPSTSSGTVSTSTPTSTQTPTPTPAPTSNVSGTVVDETSNTPLSGIQIAIAPWSVGATPSPIATTNAQGAFSFSTIPGSYLLVVGSNSPADTRATLHQGVILMAGANALTATLPSPAPNVTYAPSQLSGNFRLLALSAIQQDCVTGANSGRTNLSLPLLVPDEYLEEDTQAILAEEIAQNTDTPTPLFGLSPLMGSPSGGTTEGNGTAGFNPCDSWTGTAYSYVSGNPPYPFATNKSNAWYAATISTTPGYGSQLWQTNPEGVGVASRTRDLP